MPAFSDLITDEKQPEQTSTLSDLVSPEPVRAEPIGRGLRRPDQNKGFAGDIATSLKRGVLGLPGAVAGLADIPTALFQGMRPFTKTAEFVGEKTGFRPGKWSEEAAKEYSPGYQESQRAVGQVWEDPSKTGLDVASEYLKHPEYIAGQIAESVPSMVAGGLVGRGLMTAGRVATSAAGRGVATKGAGFLERAVGEKLASPIAAGIGEGAVQAGQAMSLSQGEDQRKNAIAALSSGIITAAIGAGAGRVAQKLGLETAETLMVKGFNTAIRKELSLGKGVLGTVKRIAGGAVSESILQELPQSAQEAVFQNYADGKPLWEGVNRQAVEGALAGFAMGAGANVLPGRGAPAETDIDRASEQLLANIIPDSKVKVVDGMATVIRETEAGPTTITAPVDIISKTIAAGDNIDDIIPEEKPVEADIPEERPYKKIFEKLPEDPTAPDAIDYSIRGAEYRYTAPEGMTKQDMLTAIEGKSDAAAVSWLKKNAVLTPKEVATVAAEEVATVAAEEVAPVAAEEVAPVAAEEVAPAPASGTLQDIVAPKAVAKPSTQYRVEWIDKDGKKQVGEWAGSRETVTGAVERMQKRNPQAKYQVGTKEAVEVTATKAPEISAEHEKVYNYFDKNINRSFPGFIKAIEAAGLTDKVLDQTQKILGIKPTNIARASVQVNPNTIKNIARDVIEKESIAEAPAAVVPERVAPAAGEVIPTKPVDVIPPKGTVADEEDITTLFAATTPEPGVDRSKISRDRIDTLARGYLGKGYDNLIRRGKIGLVQSTTDLYDIVKAPKKGADRVVGTYIPKLKKLMLVEDNLTEANVETFLRHEIAHALLREDKVFVDVKDKIFEDFGLLAGSDQTVRDAFTRAAKVNPPARVLEEALAYWMQDDKNQKHSIFKRVISAIKLALRRLGIPVTKFTTTDLARLFSQGTKAWSQQEDTAAQPGEPEALFATVDDTLKAGKDRMVKAAAALSDPKSKLHDLYVQHAPKWLSVTPLNTLVQMFGKTIHQIKDFARYLDEVVAAKTEIVDTSAVKHDIVETAAKASVGVDTFNRAAAIASFNRMTPWEDIYNQDWVPNTGTLGNRLKNAQKSWVATKMQEATGLSYTQAYAQAQKAYKDLKSEKLKDAYIGIVEHIASVRIRERNNLLAYIEATSPEGSDLRKDLMAQFDASFNNLQGAYWPLARVGDFILEYTDKEGFRQVKHFTSVSERNAAKDTALEEGVSPDSIKEDFKDKQPKGAVAIPQMLMGQLSSAVESKYLAKVDQADPEAVESAKQRAQETINDMNQIWLRWQPETSSLKNAIQRKNVKGFSEDMLRSYLDYMQKHASNIAWSEQGRKIDDVIGSLSEDIKTKKSEKGADVTMDRHILNDLRARIQALKTVSVGPVASTLGKLGTAYYMTSPSIALVQMSQLGVLTYPKLAVKYGPAKAAKAMAKGVGESFTRKFTRDAMFSDPEVNLVYENLRSTVTDENRTTPQSEGKAIGDRLYSDEQILQQIKSLSPYQKQLLTLRESMARNLLDISAAHEAYELTRGKDPKSLRNRAFNLAMLPMSLSELTSRKATVLSTMELSEKQGKNFFETMSDVADVVNDTLYSYSKEGKGAALQGGMSRVILQFQHYRIMTGIRLALLFRNAIKGETPEVKKAATKEFVGIMGMTGALAGSLGLPLSQSIFAILNTVLGDEDEPEDYQLMFTNWLQENFGKTAGDVAAKGLPTLLGADVSRRIGLADIYGAQNEPPTGLHGRNLAAWWAASQLGPIFSVGQGWAQGYDEMVNKGNFMKGLEAATPKPIRDTLKAYRIATEGLKTGRGKKILDDAEIGPDEIAMIALGFNADEVSRAQASERSLRGLSTQISERRGKLTRDAARAIIEGEGSESALADIRKFNKKMPRFAVTGRDIRPAMRRIVLGEIGTTGLRERSIASKYEIPVYGR